MIKKTLKYFLLSLSIFFSLNLLAQKNNVKFERINAKEGLSQVVVNAMIQDSKGFIWIGTQDGLNRYDGYEFKVFRPDFENPEKSIPSGFVRSGGLFEDKDNNIWICTNSSGLAMYNPKQDRFNNWQSETGDVNSLSSNMIFSYFLTPNGNVWVHTIKGIDKIVFEDKHDKSKYKVVRFGGRFGKNGHKLSKIERAANDENLNLWMLQKGKILLIEATELDKNTPQVINFSANNKLTEQYFYINLKVEDEMWFFAKNKILKVNSNTLKFKIHNYQQPEGFYIPVYSDKKKLYFSQEDKGLCILNLNTNEASIFTHNVNNPNSLSSNIVVNVLKDNSGIVWIGTNNGISKLNPSKNRFYHYDIRPWQEDWLHSGYIFSMAETEKGKLWILSYNGKGIYIYDIQKNSFRTLYNEIKPENRIPTQALKKIVVDSQSNVWVGTQDKGLFKFNKKRKAFEHISLPGEKNRRNGENVLSLTKDSDTNLLVTTVSGFYKVDIATDSATHFLKENKAKGVIIGNTFIQSVEIDDKGNYWLGGTTGLFRGVRKDNMLHIVQHYRAVPSNKDSLSENSILYTKKQNDSTLWIATFGGGLNKLNTKTGKFKRLTVKNGLANNTVYGFLCDENNRMWISTNNGLSVLNLKDYSFKNYDVNDGLQSNEFNEGSFYKDLSGKMYFGGINGLNSFYPSAIKKDTIPPVVVFTDFKLFNKSVKPGKDSPLRHNITYAQKVVLNHKQHDFTFEFAGLHYASPHKNKYAYKIEGYHSEWIEIGNKRSVSFTGFPHGEYTLKVKAANANGVWSKTPTEISLIIHPPFWKTNTFYVSAVLFIIFLVGSFIKLRERNLRRENIILEQRVQIRTKTISAQNEELKQQKEEIEAQAEELETINHELEKLSIVASETENAVIIMNANGDFEWVNEGFVKIYGYTLEEYIARYGKNILTNSTNSKINTIFDECITKKQAVSYEFEFNVKQGETIWAQTTLTPILEYNGEIRKIVAIDSDISELKEADQKIQLQNEQITDSIKYAKRIQKAVIPTHEAIDKFFSESFVLFKPKTIVSGDFYWATKLRNGKIAITVADCTGHGVPGAFMSMLGIAFLNEIANNLPKSTEISAAEFLEKLRRRVMKALHQTGTEIESKDAMDMALCLIDTQKQVIEYSGAYNSMLLFSESELNEYKADRMPVGVYYGKLKPFTNQIIPYQKGDAVYLFSDGYLDQFGGKFGRKFLKTNFMKLISANAKKSMTEQKQVLEQSLVNWMRTSEKEYEQLDDITVLGFRF